MMEWRRNRGDAVLDAEAAGWTKFKIATAKKRPWDGKTETWYRAETKSKTKTWRKSK